MKIAFNLKSLEFIAASSSLIRLRLKKAIIILDLKARYSEFELFRARK